MTAFMIYQRLKSMISIKGVDFCCVICNWCTTVVWDNLYNLIIRFYNCRKIKIKIINSLGCKYL